MSPVVTARRTAAGSDASSSSRKLTRTPRAACRFSPAVVSPPPRVMTNGLSTATTAAFAASSGAARTVSSGFLHPKQCHGLSPHCSANTSPQCAHGALFPASRQAAAACTSAASAGVGVAPSSASGGSAAQRSTVGAHVVASSCGICCDAGASGRSALTAWSMAARCVSAAESEDAAAEAERAASAAAGAAAAAGSAMTDGNSAVLAAVGEAAAAAASRLSRELAPCFFCGAGSGATPSSRSTLAPQPMAVRRVRGGPPRLPRRHGRCRTSARARPAARRPDLVRCMLQCRASDLHWAVHIAPMRRLVASAGARRRACIPPVGPCGGRGH